MSHDPYAVLRIPPTATVAQARLAFRGLALKHHPDRNPGDARAHDRFKAILRAYRAVLSRAARAQAGHRETTPAGPRPDRYACARCGDSFPFPETCPRCGVHLCDRVAGPPVDVEEPAVRRLIEVLESRPEPTADWEERLPVPAMLVAGCLMMAAFAWQIGPIGPALLFIGFATYVTALEMHRRASLALTE